MKNSKSQQFDSEQTDICIIGAGASGLMAAGFAAVSPLKVLVIEKNAVSGKKLSITGKGRCNITNSAGVEECIANIPGNGKFLYSAFNALTNEDIVTFFEERQVKTILERGGRIFPKSNEAHDVTNALLKNAQSKGVRFLYSSPVDAIEVVSVQNASIKSDVVSGDAGVNNAGGTNASGIDDGVTDVVVTDVCGTDIETQFNIHLKNNKTIRASKLILATGGMSYPGTGSTGDGYRFAKELGHTIVPPKPSLIPLNTVEKWPGTLTGLTLKNVTVKLFGPNGKLLFQELGEMLFTHFGVSGPLILSGSRHLLPFDFRDCKAVIDLKPALSEEKLYNRLTRDFEMYSRKQLKNALGDLLPIKLIPIVIEHTKIDENTPVNSLTKADKLALVSVLKALPMTIRSARPISEAIITAGGVSTKEINASTMESKLVKNLYFCGEIIDVDGYTGGFNLSIAFATGYLAGRNAVKSTAK